MGLLVIQAAPPPVVNLAGHMRNWLTRNGMPVRDFSTSFGVPDGASGRSAAGHALPGQVFIGPRSQRDVQSVAARYGKRGPLTSAQLEALRVMMHEGIHQMRYGRGEGVAGRYEEAATEAMTQDLLPIFTRKMYGHRIAGAGDRFMDVGTDYEGDVKNLRQLSVFGSGSKKFTDYGARAWRRNFTHATDEERERLSAIAAQARVAWGQRNGRAR